MTANDVFDWGSIAVGTTFTAARTFTTGDLDEFARLSGDDNPLHMDRAFAVAKGFADRVVYGGLLVAHISKAIGTQFPATRGLWHSLNIRFMRPVHPGQEVILSMTVKQVSEATRSVVLGCVCARDEAVVAKGDATVVLFKDA